MNQQKQPGKANTKANANVLKSTKFPENSEENSNSNENCNSNDKDMESKEDFEDFLCVQELAREAELKCKEHGKDKCIVRCAADFMTISYSSKQNRFFVEPKLSIHGTKAKHFTHDVQYLQMIEAENKQRNELSVNGGKNTAKNDISSSNGKKEKEKEKEKKVLNDEAMIEVD